MCKKENGFLSKETAEKLLQITRENSIFFEDGLKTKEAELRPIIKEKEKKIQEKNRKIEEIQNKIEELATISQNYLK